MTSQPIDQTRCPLCGENNDCGVAQSAGDCWCFSLKVPDDVLDRVPPELRDKVCVCERCATGRRSPAETQAILTKLTRDR
ncbi:MAG: cysteine-rich CWC family protein [Vicinamibacterales bacterium]